MDLVGRYSKAISLREVIVFEGPVEEYHLFVEHSHQL